MIPAPDSTMITNDDIKIRELLRILLQSKKLITIVTVTVTAIVFIYTLSKTPLYSGKATIEIGEVMFNNDDSDSKPILLTQIDRIADLQEITVQVMLSRLPNRSIIMEVPKESSRLLRISTESPTKEAVTETLQSTIAFILERHHQKVSFYTSNSTRIYPTHIISMQISDTPSIPKRNALLLTGFAAGLLLGILSALAAEWYRRT